MIKIEIDFMVTLYLIISILILVIWIIFERKNKSFYKADTDNFLWECPTCFYTYIDSCSEGISKCPKCQTLHRKREKV